MNAVVRHELRQLAWSRLLWVGLLLTGALVYLRTQLLLPMLAGADLQIVHSGYLLSGVWLLLGSELARRDRHTGVDQLVTAAPTLPARLLGARLVAVAAAAAAAVALVWAAGLGWSLVRGGHGWPDPRLLADQTLAMVLAAAVGVGFGLAVRARVAALLAAVAWVAGTFLVADLDQVERLRLSWQWLSPYLAPTVTRSAIVGVQPDVGWSGWAGWPG
jgi:hypothetical protein